MRMQRMCRSVVVLVACVGVLAAGNSRGGETAPLVRLVKLLDGFAPKVTATMMVMVDMEKTMKKLDGFPDAEGLKKDLSAKAGSLRNVATSATELHTFLEENGDALRAAGLEPKLSSLPPKKDIQEIARLAEGLDGLAAGIRTAQFQVYANENWQRSDVNVNKGDIVSVATDGEWKVNPKMPAVSGKGFDRKELEALAPNVGWNQTAEKLEAERLVEGNRGCLLLRIRGSEKVHTPVGGRNIEADMSGRVEFRVNDRKVDNNSGVCKAMIVVIEWRALASLMKAGGGPVPASRSAARKTKCASNLKQIGYACHLYSGDFGERFPPNLVSVHPAYIPDRVIFGCPNKPTAMSYGYVSGLTPTGSKNWILAFDKKGNHEGGRLVLFVGGNPQWATDDVFQQRLRQTLEEARGRGLKVKVIE